MKDQTIREVLRLYNAGTLVAAPQKMQGGLLHLMYRLHAQRGAFAVKVLNPNIMQYANVRPNFRASERIAAAIASAGIPAITALPDVNGEVLHDIGSDTVMVFPWLDAVALPLPAVSAGLDRARIIGNLLGRIHNLSLRFPEMQPPSGLDQNDDTDGEWLSLVEIAERVQFSNAAELRALLPRITEWIRLSHEAKQALLDFGDSDRAWVISHSDLDQKNVLWGSDGRPYMIDWESAGYVQAAIEAVVAALDWSGQVAGALDMSTFDAFLEGYRRERPLTTQEVRYGLQAYCGNWSGWLKFNVQRAVGLVTSDPEEQRLGRSETINTLAMLRSAAVNLSQLMVRS